MNAGLYAWLGGLVAVILAAFGVYTKGRKDGRARADANAAKDKLAVSERTNAVLRSSQDIRNDVASRSDDDVNKRLQDKYSRD